MGNSKREMDIVRNNQKRMLEIKKKKNTEREMKNVFDGHITSLDWLNKESEPQDITIEASNIKMQGKEKL